MDIGKSDEWKEEGLPPIENYIRKVVSGRLPIVQDKIKDRESRFPEDIFIGKQIYRKNVVLVGTGALGSLLSFNLVKLGTDLIMVDHDKVSPSNLNRSLFTLDDIGRTKAFALTDILHPYRTIDGQKISGYALPFDEFKKLYRDVLEEADLVIAAVDNQKAIFQVTDFCHKRSVPMIVSGVSEDTTTLKVFWDAPWAKGGCYRCFHPDEDMKDGGNGGCDGKIHPSIVYPHAIAAGWVTYIVKAILMEEHLGYRELRINIKHGGNNIGNTDSREGCEICGGKKIK